MKRPALHIMDGDGQPERISPPLMPRIGAFMHADAGHQPMTCTLGTYNGEAATGSQFGFARCALDFGHRGGCDSGPVTPDAA